MVGHFIDFFEVAIVIGACFLVNSVTDDAKTNWVEGLVLLSFYMMIVSKPSTAVIFLILCYQFSYAVILFPTIGNRCLVL